MYILACQWSCVTTWLFLKKKFYVYYLQITESFVLVIFFSESHLKKVIDVYLKTEFETVRTNIPDTRSPQEYLKCLERIYPGAGFDDLFDYEMFFEIAEVTFPHPFSMELVEISAKHISK